MKHSICIVALCAATPMVYAEETDIITTEADVLIYANSSAHCMWCTNANVIGHTSAKEWSYVWTLKSTGDNGTYYIYNKLHKKYLGKTSSAKATVISTVADVAYAGKYSIALVADNFYQIKDTENDSDNCYVIFSSSSITNGTSENSSANIRVVSADTETATLTKSILNYCDKRVGNYIGGVADSDELQELIEALKETGDFQTATQLTELVGESINMPKAGHYYQIQSAYPAYKDKIIAETYYTKDYYSNHDAQRLFYLNMEPETETIMVPTFWQFERAGINQYYIKGANSSKYWRHSTNNILISLVDKSSSNLGMFSIFNQYYDKVVYDNAVVFYSTNRWGSDYSSCVSIFEGDDEGIHDFDVRHSDSKVDATNSTISITEKKQPNNWYITEVTEFDLYFPQNSKAANLDSNGNIILVDNDETKSFRTVYFPFAVLLPEGLTAYTLVDKKSLIEGAFEVGEIDNYGSGVIPALTPALLVGEPGATYTLTINYNDKNKPVQFDLIGTLEPYPVPDATSIYVIDDENGHTSHTLLKVGGQDYSYDKDYLYKSTGKAWYSVYNSDATYIVDHNRAYIKPSSSNLAAMKPMEQGNRTSTGAEDIVIDKAEEIRYYDIYGRQVHNPQRGLFIRSDGKKVILR